MITEDSTCIFTPRSKKLLALAARIAKEWGHSYVGCEHILAAFNRIDGPANEIIKSKEITEDFVKTQIGLIASEITAQEKLDLLKQQIARLDGYMKNL